MPVLEIKLGALRAERALCKASRLTSVGTAAAARPALPCVSAKSTLLLLSLSWLRSEEKGDYAVCFRQRMPSYWSLEIAWHCPEIVSNPSHLSPRLTINTLVLFSCTERMGLHKSCVYLCEARPLVLLRGVWYKCVTGESFNALFSCL